MKKLILPILTLITATGCIPQKQSSKTPEPKPLTELVKTDDNQYKVVEVITKPILITRKGNNGQESLVKVLPNNGTQATVSGQRPQLIPALQLPAIPHQRDPLPPLNHPTPIQLKARQRSSPPMHRFRV